MRVNDKMEKIQNLFAYNSKIAHYRKMDFLYPSEQSFDTLSIKLTENHIPSSTVIKSSQENISLTYTVSLENVSDRNIPSRKESAASNPSIKFDHQSPSQQSPLKYQPTETKQPLLTESDLEQIVTETQCPNLFKKKEIYKVNNIDFSNVLEEINKEDSSLELSTRAKKFLVRGSTSGIFAKGKNSPEVTTSSKLMFSKSKDKFKDSSSQNFTENLLLRTNKFYAMKNDKVIEPIPLRKKCISVKRDLLGESKVAASPSDRKAVTKLPSIKGTAQQGASMTQRRKAFTTHEAVENCEKFMAEKSDKLLVGKTCRIAENDKKARIYLQKIIQNRNSVIHYNDKQRQHKQNGEDFVF